MPHSTWVPHSTFATRSDMDLTPQPTNDHLTLSYVAYTASPRPGYAFKLLNKYTQCSDCRRNGVHFYGADGSYRVIDKHGNPSSALCYKPDPRRGTIVPQWIWQPELSGGVKRHIQDGNLLWPIHFKRQNGVVGFNMSSALSAGGFFDIVGANTPAPMGELATTKLSLQWPGYHHDTRQVEIRDGDRSPITMSKLAERVVRFVRRYIQNASAKENIQGQWRIGPGAIGEEHIYIIGLMHVSRGVWQIMLQLDGLVYL
ncbi:unnamed protein product [Peniophora sp. CBMAI 1063]|nr:unnamed protein product [Peniophora sp. CBMAI 1063]